MTPEPTRGRIRTDGFGSGPVVPGLGPGAGVVDVWWIDLDAADETARETLDEEERVRADRFAFEDLRRRFVAARSALRHVLGLYLDRVAAEVRFAYGEHGKPRLVGDGPKFNLSHSGDRAVVAVVRDRPVGIDVELLRDVADSRAIARRFFAPSEVDLLERVAGPRYGEAFLRIWTRKESYLKAVGKGLAHPLHAFEIVGDGSPIARIRIPGDEPVPFEIHDLAAPDDAVASLAVRTDSMDPPIEAIVCRRWLPNGTIESM